MSSEQEGLYVGIGWIGDEVVDEALNEPITTMTSPRKERARCIRRIQCTEELVLDPKIFLDDRNMRVIVASQRRLWWEYSRCWGR